MAVFLSTNWVFRYSQIVEEILFSAACERNREPIAAVLDSVLPTTGTVLEVASGTGQHADYFSARYPNLRWQTSDQDPRYLTSVGAVVARAGRANLLAPLTLDTTHPWPIVQADAIFCANMIHIAPWEATVGLFQGAGRILARSAPLITYGPYRVDGEQTAASNAQFEQHLKSLDPRFGIRDIGELETLAEEHGLSLKERFAMPANNFILHWTRSD